MKYLLCFMLILLSTSTVVRAEAPSFLERAATAAGGTFHAVGEVPIEVWRASIRAAYESARKLGLLRGSFDDRQRLKARLATFLKVDERLFLDGARPTYADPLYRQIDSILIAERHSERGDFAEAKRLLRESHGAPQSRAARLAAEAEAVLLGRRASWAAVGPRCTQPITEIEPSLFDPDDIAYGCAQAAAEAGDLAATLEIADRVPEESLFRPYVWWAAVIAAQRTESWEDALRVLERVSGHRADWHRRMATDAALRKRLTITGDDPGVLLEERARAALVVLYAKAGNTDLAEEALEDVSVDSPWYLQAIATLPEPRVDELRASAGGQEAPEPRQLLQYASSLLHANRPELAAEIISSAMARLPLAEARAPDLPDVRWTTRVLELETDRLRKEAARRVRIAHRVWPLLGAFGTSPEPASPERPHAESLESGDENALLRVYLSREDQRLRVRSCLRRMPAAGECRPHVVEAYRVIRSAWAQDLREVNYQLDRLLADALLNSAAAHSR